MTSHTSLVAGIEAFKGFKESFLAHGDKWKKMYDSINPHEEKFAGDWETKLTGMSRLIVLRCIRSDKLILGIQQFIISVSGEKFMKVSSVESYFPLTPTWFLMPSIQSPMRLALLVAASAVRPRAEL